jgi:hypothetical protein
MRVWVHALIPSLPGFLAADFFLKSFSILLDIGEKSKGQKKREPHDASRANQPPEGPLPPQGADRSGKR